jgi:chemotaxis protein methyltransferase CheR
VIPAPTTADVERFRELIARRFGLHHEDGRLGFLADVLCRRLEASRRASEPYLDQLERGGWREEVTGLAHELTIPETYFFRHLDQFRAFSEAVIPELMRARARSRKLRILSAGCASGEEAYTLAIALREIALDPGWEVSILAIDINRSVLDKAAAGRFSTWSLRETPREMQARWFRPCGRDLELHESVRAQVRFEQRNLADDDHELWRSDSFDVVFCRNVIMYFTPRTAQEVVGRISRSLAPGGYLFLGHAETLRGMSHEFHLCHTHEAFYYQRKDGADHVAPAGQWGRPSDAPVRVDAGSDLAADSWVEAIGEAADRIRVLTDRGNGHVAAAPPAPAAPDWDLRTPLELLRQERFDEALDQVRVLPPESAGDPDVRLLEAVLLAHSGQLAEAEEACLDLLRIDELNAGAHYVLALCCEGGGDGRRAVEHDQVAAYLDPDFAMPRLHLGLLARRAGEHDAARRELGRALALLHREDASRLLFFGGGFHREALVALCRAELIACGGQP